MTDEAILRIAAISAVLSIIESQDDDGANIGRNTGNAWSQDHIRMSMGLNSLMNARSSRSPWR
jgi:hypothetical protein